MFHYRYISFIYIYIYIYVYIGGPQARNLFTLFNLFSGFRYPRLWLPTSFASHKNETLLINFTENTTWLRSTYVDANSIFILGVNSTFLNSF